MIAWTTVLVAAAGLVTLQDGAVLLRGPAGKRAAAVGAPTAVSAAGVTVAGGTVLAWDQVKQVTGPLAAEAERFRGLSERAWRARIRLERGDLVLAEPMLEELFSELSKPAASAGTSAAAGPTAAGIAASLLKCRVERGAYAGAVKPWLGYLHATGAGGAGAGGGADVGRLLDAATGLCPVLPPMWSPGSGVRQLGEGGIANVESGEAREAKVSAWAERSRLLGELYVAAARAESGLPATLPDVGGNADTGVRLVYDIVKSRIGDSAERREARRLLSERIGPKSAGWVEAWCRVAIGRSLLLEADEDMKREGVLNMVYVASRGVGGGVSAVDGWLTGLALAEAAVGLESLGGPGDHVAAVGLAGELADRFAGHPSLEWGALRALLPKRVK